MGDSESSGLPPGFQPIDYSAQPDYSSGYSA